jgi:hypothetical protein
MLTDKKNIDQLFRTKLRDYEAIPPPSAWNVIESELKVNQKARKIKFLKAAGIAAAVVSAFLAGWWLTNPTNLNEISENVTTVKVAPKTEVNGPVNPKESLSRSTLYSAPATGASDQLITGFTNSTRRQYKPAITSMASFAPSTSLLNKNPELSPTETKEPALIDVEKEFLSHFQNNKKLIKQFSDWVTSFNSKGNPSDTIRTKTPAIQSMRQSGTDKIPVFAADSRKETINDKRGSWMLSAELSPVSFTQRQGGSSISGQQTSFENSVSGSMLAGYKIGKKIVVKSGIILSQLKQVTNISDYPAAYSSDITPFKTASVATTSGKVNMNTAVVPKSDVLFSNTILPSPGIQAEIKQEFRYIEIPVQVGYKIIDHKFNLGVTGGVSTNILAGNRAGLYETGQRINKVKLQTSGILLTRER